MTFRTLDNVDVAGKRVLLRADLNVPVRDGKISDLTRLERLTPTIRELVGKGAKVIVCSHFDRPKGKRVPSMSLAPIADRARRGARPAVRFAEDCIGLPAQQASNAWPTATCWCWRTPATMPRKKRTTPLRRRLAKLADILRQRRVLRRPPRARQHRGRGAPLPAYAGRLMQAELEALHAALGRPVRPVAAVVGGARFRPSWSSWATWSAK